MNWPEIFRWAREAAFILLGALIGFWLTRRHSREQWRHAFVERQLAEFYSPLLALRTEAQLKGKVADTVLEATKEEWNVLCAGATKLAKPDDALRRLHEKRGGELDRSIEYYNDQLANKLLPSYRQMITIFREKRWLAEPETRPYLPALIQFVELRERWLAGAVSSEVIKSLRQAEEPLQEFYEHLKKKHDELRKLLSQGKA